MTLFLIYATVGIFTLAFTLDFIATIRQAWKVNAPATTATDPTPAAAPAAATAPATAPAATIAPAPAAAAPALPNPWDSTTTLTATPAATSTAAPTQLLLAPAKEVVTPATIVSKPPQTSDDYNHCLTVQQLRCKARAAGVKNFGRMKKRELLAALA